MIDGLSYWCSLYDKYKYEAICLDIETIGMNKEISVICFYQPKDGPIEVIQLVRGNDLNVENIKQAMLGCKLLITYNGIYFDLPRIKREFPNSIPEDIPVLDLFRFSKKLGAFTNLKVLEQTFRIERLRDDTQKRGIAVKLWKKFSEFGNSEALDKLLEYNKQDAINLFPLAERLVEMAKNDEMI